MTTSPDRTATEAREQIGLIGLGLMGGAIARRLIAGGFDVVGFDIRPEAVSAAQQIGVNPAPEVGEVAAKCRRIVFSLYDSATVRTVLSQIRDELRPGQIIIDTTTGDAETAAEIGGQLAAINVAYLDTTISGNSEQLAEGDVTVLAGGRRDAFDQCQDLFRLFCRHSLHVGNCGAGTKMKLVTNLVLGLNRAALAEALVFADSLGIAPADALEALRASMAYSRIMDSKGPKMVTRDFTPQARLSQHLKDVRLILAAGEKSGLDMPLSRVHQQILEAAEAAGLGQMDNSAIIKVFEKRNSSKKD